MVLVGPKSSIHQKPDTWPGLLLLLVIVSGFIGYWVMMHTTYESADFVILTMSIGTAVSLGIAIVNWIVAKLTGFRFLSRIAQQVTFVMVPPLLLIFLVLGTIFIGLATPTEGGAMGAVGALLLALSKRLVDKDPNRFNFTIVRQAVAELRG